MADKTVAFAVSPLILFEKPVIPVCKKNNNSVEFHSKNFAHSSLLTDYL